MEAMKTSVPPMSVRRLMVTATATILAFHLVLGQVFMFLTSASSSVTLLIVNGAMFAMSLIFLVVATRQAAVDGVEWDVTPSSVRRRRPSSLAAHYRSVILAP